MANAKLYAGALAATLVAAGASLPVQAKPLLIGYSVWVGYGPIFVAQEKGFFADEGLEVQMIRMEDGLAEALYDDLFDATAITLDEVAAWFEPEHTPVCVLALDDSIGGDGIVALKEIQGVADLKGRTVAFANPSVSEFYLNVVLQEAGLSAADIEPVLLSGQDAGEAFLLREVDAAVTWEPWLTEGATAEHGHLLTDSSERPGLIVDCLVTKASVFKQRKGDFQAFARAWAAAVDYYDAHPEEAIEIMSRHVGGWLEEPAAFAETLEGVRLYGRERSEAYLGTPQNPGPIYQTAQKAIDVWSGIGRLKTDISPADMIGHGIWDQ